MYLMVLIHMFSTKIYPFMYSYFKYLTEVQGLFNILYIEVMCLGLVLGNCDKIDVRGIYRVGQTLRKIILVLGG
jgi:uncharacterized protein YebE (UPF0316 family)